MATATLVNNNIFEEGHQFLNYLDKTNLDIRVAFWYYQKENNSWKLMLSTPEVEKLGSRFFYSKILGHLKTFSPKTSISPLDIVILSYSDILISVLKKAIKTPPAPSINSIRFSNNLIDGILIEDALIYRLS